MDIKEDDIYKLFALGWKGKESPIKFLNNNYNINFTYSPNTVFISYRHGEINHNIILYHCSYTNISRIINAALKYFKTENGKVLGPNYEYYKDEPEWT